MKNALEITSLRKTYEGFTLNNVSFNLPFTVEWELMFLAVGILLPFIYRFGLMGIMIAMAAGVVFLILGVAMTALLKNPAFKDSLIGRTVRSVLSGVFSQIEGSGLPGVLEKTISNLGMPLFIVLMVLIMIIILFISFRISLYIFNKKEL